jgi:hypothetical protein
MSARTQLDRAIRRELLRQGNLCLYMEKVLLKHRRALRKGNASIR